MTHPTRLNRRNFLRTTSAAAAAGVFTGSSSFSLAQDSPNERPVFRYDWAAEPRLDHYEQIHQVRGLCGLRRR